jgi:hypothetical protein
MVYFALTDNVLASNPLPDPGCDLGRNVFRAIWWIIGLGILAIVGLAWLGSTLPDQPKPATVAPTPTPKLLEYANSSEAAGSPAPAPTASSGLLEYGFDDK